MPALGGFGPGGGGIDVKVYLDGREIAARVVRELHSDYRQVQSAGGGRG